MTFQCINDCELEVWDGSGKKVAVSKGESLEMSYHEFDGSIGLKKDGVELFCGVKDKVNFETKTAPVCPCPR